MQKAVPSSSISPLNRTTTAVTNNYEYRSSQRQSRTNSSSGNLTIACEVGSDISSTNLNASHRSNGSRKLNSSTSSRKSSRQPTHDGNEPKRRLSQIVVRNDIDDILPIAASYVEDCDVDDFENDEFHLHSHAQHSQSSTALTNLVNNNTYSRSKQPSFTQVYDQERLTFSTESLLSGGANPLSFETIMRNPKNQWTHGLKSKIIDSFSRGIDEVKTEEYLTMNRWPKGLQLAVMKSCKRIPLRFFIVDDSGSMTINDGRRVLVTSDKNEKLIQCTRWAELTDSMKFHIGLADAMGTVAEFRTLNTSRPILIGLGNDDGEAKVRAIENFDEEEPHGQTPLCEHITKVVVLLQSVASELRELGQMACVIIATDGLATDGDIVQAMRPLTSLPVWVIVRLCTNEGPVVEFWNNIDKQLELNIDVIDDLEGEAKEIYKVNNWMTYGVQLQRFREFGSTSKEMDVIDESALGKEQMRSVCGVLLSGGNAKLIPHPDADWNEFIRTVRSLNKEQGLILCPIEKRMKNWIDVASLKKAYSPKSVIRNCTIL